MRFLYKILVLCSLLIMSVSAFAQITTTTNGSLTIFTLGDSTKSITLNGNAVNASAYQWYKNGVMISGALSQTYTATASGFYTVVAFSSEGCPSPHADSVSVVFTNPTIPPPVVTPPPAVDSVDLAVTISSSNTQATTGNEYSYTITAENNSNNDGTNVQLSYTIPSNLTYVSQTQNNGTVSYNDSTKTLVWNMATLEKSSSANLTVNVKVASGGLAVSTVSITGTQFDPNMQNNTSTIEQQVNSLIVPNVFTPNGDGVNDTFVVPGLENFSDNQLSVMNRWGSEVYVRKNYKNDWTGQGLVEGTYFYILKTKTSLGNWEVYKGYITLLRSHL